MRDLAPPRSPPGGGDAQRTCDRDDDVPVDPERVSHLAFAEARRQAIKNRLGEVRQSGSLLRREFRPLLWRRISGSLGRGLRWSGGKLHAERSVVRALRDGGLIVAMVRGPCVSEAMIENEIQSGEDRLLRAVH